MSAPVRISRYLLVACLALALLLVSVLIISGPLAKVGGADGDEVAMRHSSVLRIVECDGYSVVGCKGF